MNPLCVTSTTCDLSEIGRHNIENIKNLGVDYIEMSPNPIIRAKLNKIGLKTIGDISWPEHVGIFTIPVRAAVQYNVPLIVWGENSQNEYGGPAAAADNKVLNRRWLEEFGGLLGLRTNDLLNPFPEEANRRIISQIASLNFAPTEKSKRNLLNAGIGKNITVTGNTVIDSLIYVVNKYKSQFKNEILLENKKIILVTVHRRENWGENLKNTFRQKLYQNLFYGRQ